jgi:hypothetical protein
MKAVYVTQVARNFRYMLDCVEHEGEKSFSYAPAGKSRGSWPEYLTKRRWGCSEVCGLP